MSHRFRKCDRAARSVFISECNETRHFFTIRYSDLSTHHSALFRSPAFLTARRCVISNSLRPSGSVLKLRSSRCGALFRSLSTPESVSRCACAGQGVSGPMAGSDARHNGQCGRAPKSQPPSRGQSLSFHRRPPPPPPPPLGCRGAGSGLPPLATNRPRLCLLAVWTGRRLDMNGRRGESPRHSSATLVTRR